MRCCEQFRSKRTFSWRENSFLDFDGLYLNKFETYSTPLRDWYEMSLQARLTGLQPGTEYEVQVRCRVESCPFEFWNHALDVSAWFAWRDCDMHRYIHGTNLDILSPYQTLFLEAGNPLPSRPLQVSCINDHGLRCWHSWCTGQDVLPCPYSRDTFRIQKWSETCCGNSLCKLRPVVFLPILFQTGSGKKLFEQNTKEPLPGRKR